LREKTAPTIHPLTVSMIESSLGTLLVTTVGYAPFLAISLVTTGGTAITLSTIAVATDPEQLSAGEANPLT
jgi:hypothetical protein